MRVLICGDRNWNDTRHIEQFIESLPPTTTIVEGDCRGADRISGYYARKHGLTVEAHPAQWNLYGLRAGYLRNLEMIQSGVDIVIVFHNDLAHSRGTIITVNLAKQRNIPILINPRIYIKELM